MTGQNAMTTSSKFLESAQAGQGEKIPAGLWLLFGACGAITILWHLSHRRQGTLRTGWSCSCICQLHALCCYASICSFQHGFSLWVIYNFVFISVVLFDFGGFFLFNTVNKIWWLANLT